MADVPANQGDKRLPPVDTRFKPGQSGNPKGRPPLEHTLSACLRAFLGQNEPKSGQTYEQLLAQAVVIGGIQAARKGNGGLAQFIFERVEGKMPELIDLRAIEVMMSKPVEEMSVDELDAYDFQLQQLIKKYAPHGLPALLPAGEENDSGTTGPTS